MSVDSVSSVGSRGDPAQGGPGIWAGVESVRAMEGSGVGEGPRSLVPVPQVSHMEKIRGLPGSHAITSCVHMYVHTQTQYSFPIPGNSLLCTCTHIHVHMHLTPYTHRPTDISVYQAHIYVLYPELPIPAVM